MPLSSVGSQGSPASVEFPATTPLNRSRETAEVLPDPRSNDGLITDSGKPVAKPWAHFVAGGYEQFLDGSLSSTN